MRLRTALAGIGAATVVLLSACGNGPPPDQVSGAAGGSGGGGGGGGGGGALQTVQQGPAAKTVQQTDSLKFDPAAVQVKAGDVVEWDNGGTTQHNVTFDDGTASSTMSQGDKFLVKFTKAGSYHYKCTFHAGMEGTVTAG